MRNLLDVSRVRGYLVLWSNGQSQWKTLQKRLLLPVHVPCYDGERRQRSDSHK
jgi:hypothetical protein